MTDTLHKLDADSHWLQFEIAGTEFHTEAFEACDLLAEIDERHAYDPHRCTACQKDFVIDISDSGGDAGKIVCPGCKSADHVRISQLFLDDVVALIKTRWQVPRVSRGEALRFYNIVVQETATAKKKSMTPAGSPTGTEGSTPPPGA